MLLRPLWHHRNALCRPISTPSAWHCYLVLSTANPLAAVCPCLSTPSLTTWRTTTMTNEPVSTKSSRSASAIYGTRTVVTSAAIWCWQPEKTCLPLQKVRHHGILIKCYHQTSNISHTLVGNKIIDHSDVVGASPVGAAPITSSSST